MTEEFGESTLAWCKFEDVWYAVLIVTHESLGLDADPGSDSRCVAFLPDFSGSVMPITSLEPFTLDDAERVNHPLAKAGVIKAQELISGVSASESADNNQPANEDADAKAQRKLQRKAEKKEKKEAKKAKKEAKKREKEERKRAAKASTAVEDQDASDSEEDEGSEASEAAMEGDALDQYIEDDTRNEQRGTVVSRLHDRRRTAGATLPNEELGAQFILASTPSFAGPLHAARAWYLEQKKEAKESNMVMKMFEVDFLRIVEAKLRTTETAIAIFKAGIKRHRDIGDAVRDKLKELEELKDDIIPFCQTLLVSGPKPPQQPEKRKGGRFQCVDPQLVNVLRHHVPLLRDADADLLRRMDNEDESRRLGQTGLRRNKKISIMKNWLRGRELPVVSGDFDVQPVAAHGAVARKFNEFTAASSDKIAHKASRSTMFSQYLSKTKSTSNRTSVGSYFNFHDFRDYQNMSSVLMNTHALLLGDDGLASEAQPVAVSVRPPDFDPEAVFQLQRDVDVQEIVDEMEWGQGRPVSGFTSVQRSAMLASEHSLWPMFSPSEGGMKDPESLDEHHEKTSNKDDSAPEGSRGRSASGSGVPLEPQTCSWRAQVKQLVIRRVSLYVNGSLGKPSCVPSHQFSDVVKDLVDRVVVRKSEKEKLYMGLRTRDVMELSEKESNAISSSVDHYIVRKFMQKDSSKSSGRERRRPSKRERSVASSAADQDDRRPVYDD